MADLLALSSRIIDEDLSDEPTNRVTQELSEVSDDLAVIESFSHVVLLRSPAGLVAFDTSGAQTGAACVQSMRTWSSEPVSHLVYTHGHVDHVGGSGAFVADAERRGDARPQVVAHEAVHDRFERYRLTDGWNLAINMRQFGWLPRATNLGIGGMQRFLPEDVAEPDLTYREVLSLDAGGVPIELHHARGETGNPQKVQRYPDEWAVALRAMAALEPELFLPAHGLPIAGKERIGRVLDEVASALEDLVQGVLERMNAGARLDQILQEVTVPDSVLARPFLRPFYDEPEFVVRNVWRRFGGWWDGDPANLKPAPAATLAQEVAHLAGGALALARRGEEVAGTDLRLACHLVELAGLAAPEDRQVHQIRADVYERRRKSERSLMANGIYASAVRESAELVDGEG
ncbi:MAG: alkyl sulfatase dimerization domain-containing protein [Actinomycetota bacterium]